MATVIVSKRHASVDSSAGTAKASVSAGTSKAGLCTGTAKASAYMEYSLRAPASLIFGAL